MPGINDENAGRVPADGPEPHAPGADPVADVAQGIRSLHERLDGLEHIVARSVVETCTHPGEWVHMHATLPQVPAWKRRTDGEARWQVTVCTLIAIALEVAVPGRLVVIHPVWVLPGLQVALLIALVAMNPGRISRESQSITVLRVTLALLLSFANAWSLIKLLIDVVQGSTETNQPTQLLVTGGAIWLTNVIVFGLWYWGADRGGPADRAAGANPHPDFLFVQMQSPEFAPQDWEPTFLDYLYVAFTNATAFSPTDTMPLSRWAKLAMTAQSIISIVTVALVIARAVNILKT